MSFNLAFWVGPASTSDNIAASSFRGMYARYVDPGDDPEPQAPELLAFLDEVTKKYPDLVDLDDDHVDEGVWSDGPLANNVTGQLLYLGIVWSRAEEVTPYLVERATRRGLVTFDPQSGAVLRG